MKIMTLNLNVYADKHGAWPARRAIVINRIAGVHPDVVLFQAAHAEPDLEGGRDSVKQLAESLPEYLHHSYQPVMSHPQGGNDGMGVLSRLPLESVHMHALTRMEGTEDPFKRAVMQVRVAAVGGVLEVFNAHFSWVTAQAEENVNEFLVVAGEARGRRLLVGDFNQPPDSAPMQRLQNAGWQDAWQALCPGEPGYTFEAPSPTVRIDYIRMPAEMLSRVISIQTVGSSPGNCEPETNASEGMSDHLGLYAEMED